MNARLRDRALGRRPRIIAGPGCFLVERRTYGQWGSQVELADTLSEAFDIACAWTKERKWSQ